MGLTAHDLRQLREILKHSQTTGDESPIAGRLAAQLPKAASLWDWLQSPAGVAVATWLMLIITILGPWIDHPEQTRPTFTQAQIEQMVQDEVREIVQDMVKDGDVVKDVDQPPQAPSEPDQPSTPPTS